MSWTGALLVLVGLWIVLRTVRPDSSDRTLVDYIMGKPPAARHA